jgi:hypothetical protein
LAETNEHTLRLRPGRLDDAEEAGRIIFEAFSTIAMLLIRKLVLLLSVFPNLLLQMVL